MKKVLCKAYGPPESLVVEEVELGSPGRGQVRVGVHGCGVNFPDTLIIKGEYQFKPPFPFAPGGEIAGEVLEVGEGVTTLEVGDRVMAMTGWGGFAEELLVAEQVCLKVPETMDLVTAAGFSMTYGTSYHALVQRGELRAGESLLVHGASGGVGTAALDIGRALGARLIATGGSDAKLARLEALYGVETTINYNTVESLKKAVKAVTGGQGADVIFDPVGGEVFEQSLRCINWKGRLLVIGFASGDIPKAAANLILLKGCAVVGVFWGSFAMREAAVNRANFEQLFAWHAEGRLNPHVSHRFDLEEAPQALNALIGREVVGKAVLLTARGREAAEG